MKNYLDVVLQQVFELYVCDTEWYKIESDLIYSRRRD